MRKVAVSQRFHRACGATLFLICVVGCTGQTENEGAPEPTSEQGCVSSGPELCNGLDDDCDGQLDEGFGTGSICTVGVGECSRRGVVRCLAEGDQSGTTCSAQAGTAVAELCNGKDDDCDDAIDEEWEIGSPCAGGLGQCAAEGAFVCASDGSRQTCDAAFGEPVFEVCNALDDDCDGYVDEDFPVGETCVIGLGACQVNGIYRCTENGVSQCQASPARPSEELCNQVDDDCDGQVDEDWDLGGACSEGIGACERQGQITCASDGQSVACDAVPAARDRGHEDRCDGLDDDCDGSIDEDWNIWSTCSAGIGVCHAEGVLVCSSSGQRAVCDAIATEPAVESCNGLDDNCDGEIDNVEFDGVCFAGTGGCRREGRWLCGAEDDNYPIVCNAVAGEPKRELPRNQIDDDCDGIRDEGIYVANMGGPEVGTFEAPFHSLSAAIEHAQQDCLAPPCIRRGSGIIWVSPGYYRGDKNKNLTWGRHPDGRPNGQHIELICQDPVAGCIIDLENDGRAFIFSRSDNEDYTIDSRDIIEGFTIINGNAQTVEHAGKGGAVYLGGGEKPGGRAGLQRGEARRIAPFLKHNTFDGNQADYGGAIFMESAEAEVYENTFRRNIALSGGAIGIDNAQSPCAVGPENSKGGDLMPVIRGNQFEDNCAGFEECVRRQSANEGLGMGGAIVATGVCQGKFQQNIFSGNRADVGGGAVGLGPEPTHAALSNNLFVNNRAPEGSALYVQGELVAPFLVNNTLVEQASVTMSSISPRPTAVHTARRGSLLYVGGPLDPIQGVTTIRNTLVEATGRATTIRFAEGTHAILNHNAYGVSSLSFEVLDTFLELNNNIELGDGSHSPTCLTGLPGNYKLSRNAPCVDAGSMRSVDPYHEGYETALHNTQNRESEAVRCPDARRCETARLVCDAGELWCCEALSGCEYDTPSRDPTPPHDLDAQTRPINAAPDIGAYEHQGARAD